ncbi:hypothetical protein GGQ68_004763 [Sagittula marina]|uniref:Group 4 capsule polysaccharide lipoprotein gfcB, YjbF n=1 Tax=Sagittula marina TaxID=943940 RepID=A0A7W6DV69_9RHOB|nr:YjbF family lipoprotein [Sagittula marina]MBB3988406.1 hypothetical protein [Sagittula marina]
MRFTRPAFVLCLALGAAACGSDRDIQSAAFASLGQLFTPKQAPAPVTDAQILEALQINAKPLILVEFEERNNAQGLLAQVETNGAYYTFGNQSRNVIVLRDGMITATRGLGGDLMSVEEDALLSLIHGRRAGQASYVQRFLLPEAVTQELDFQCAARPVGSKRVTRGLVNEEATTVKVDCYGKDTETDAQIEFTNSYAVSSSGVILSARQWVGSYLGHIETQYLRR